MSSIEPDLSLQEIADLDGAFREFNTSLALPPYNPGRRGPVERMRRVGFNVEQIRILSNGQLKESTIKSYVKGIEASSAAPAQKAVEFIRKGLDEDATISNMLEFFKVKVQADSHKIKIHDLLNLLDALSAQKIPPSEFIKYFQDLDHEGLTPVDVKTHLTYKRTIEPAGFGVNSLKQIAKASEIFGSPEKVLEAISKYTSLTHLETQLKAKEQQANNTQAQLTEETEKRENLQKEVDELERKLKSHKDVLESIDQLTAIGYDNKTLQNLAISTQNWGGIQQTLTAFKQFKHAIEIATENARLEAEKQTKITEKAQLENSNVHLKTHIEITKELVDTHKLGLDAISSLLRICKKYGKPEQVLKALEQYNGLEELKKDRQTVEEDIENKKSNLKVLEEKEKALENKVDEYLPKIATMSEKLTNDLAEKFKGITTTAETEIKTCIDGVTATLKTERDSLETSQRTAFTKTEEANKNLTSKFDETFNKALTAVDEQSKTMKTSIETIKTDAKEKAAALLKNLTSELDKAQDTLTKKFEETTTSITKQLQSVLSAAHEVDRAYEERNAETDQVKAFLQLVDLVNNPASIPNASFLTTIQLVLRKTSEWVTMHSKHFRGYYSTPQYIISRIDSLLGTLEKIDYDSPSSP
jgi:myosin heavy subunit